MPVLLLILCVEIGLHLKEFKYLDSQLVILIKEIDPSSLKYCIFNNKYNIVNI